MFPLPDRIRRRGFKGAILISPYVLRTNSGSLAIFAAILRAPSLLNNLVAVRRLLTPKRKNVRQELKQKLWLFVLYLFDLKFLKMAPGTHNVATNQINRSHCADRTRW
jgi:hypothetical protein